MSFTTTQRNEIDSNAQAFLDAAKDGDISALKEALANNPGLAHARNRRGQSALEIATRNGQVESIRVLIQYGEPEDPHGHGNLLWIATQEVQLEALKELLPHADLKKIKTGPQSPISMAAWRGWVPGLEAMAPFFDLNEPDFSEEKTPLMNAATEGRLDAIRFLLPRCDANVQGAGGETALFLAAAYGHDECVKELLTRAQPRIENHDGRTAVNSALEDHSNAKCFDLLSAHAKEEELARGLELYGIDNLPQTKARQEAAELRETVKRAPQAPARKPRSL